MERSLGIRYRVKEVLSADKFSYDTVRRGETKEKAPSRHSMPFPQKPPHSIRRIKMITVLL